MFDSKDKADLSKIDISLIDENFYDSSGKNLAEKKINPEKEKSEKSIKIFKIVVRAIFIGLLLIIAIYNRLQGI